MCGTIYKELVEIRKTDLKDIPKIVSMKADEIIRAHLLHIIDFAKNNKDKADKSWPVLLKSNAFFNHITAYLAGVAKGRASAVSAPVIAAS